MEISPMHFTSFLSESSFLTPHRCVESAWTPHVPFALWLMEQLKPKLFVELGVHTGVSYFAFCQSVKANNLATKCYAIDTWLGDEHSGLYNEDIWLDVNGYNSREYASFSYLLRTNFSEALKYFEAESIDLLHIDGLHTYEAVKNDFETWLPKMTKNGVIVFHDIMVRERDFGVYKFWNEIKSLYKTFEFYHGYGLGVLLIDDNPAHPLSCFFNVENSNNASRIRTTYAFLGNVWSEVYTKMNLNKTNSALHLEVANLRAEEQNVKAQFNYAKQQYESLKAGYEQLNGINQYLQRDLEQKQQFLNQIENENFILKQEAEIKEKEQKDTNNRFDLQTRAYETIKEREFELTEMLEKKTEALHALEAQYNALKAEHEKLQENNQQQGLVLWQEKEISMQKALQDAYADTAKEKAIQQQIIEEKKAMFDEIKQIERKLEKCIQNYDSQLFENEKIIENLRTKSLTLSKELSREKSVTEKIMFDIEHLQQSVNWYKNTYENRRLVGIIKDRLIYNKI